MATTTSTRPSYRFRYIDSVYFDDGNLFSAILIGLLYLLVAVALDAAGYVNNLSLLVPVTLGAFALALLMSYSRFDSFFALSHSLFTGLAWILFLITGLVRDSEIEPFVGNGIPDMQAKAYFVLLRWLNWVDAAVNNIANEDNYVFIFEISFLVWWLTYLGVWAVFRYGYTWRAIAPAGLVLLINTYYAPTPVLGFLVVFALVALVLLIRTNLAEQQLRWRERRIYFNQDIALDFLRSGFTFSVIVIALAWLAPGLGRSLQVRQVMAPVNAQWEEVTEYINHIYGGLDRQARPAASSFGRSLTLGGARNVTDRPIFHVQTSQGRYWRAVVFDTYTGRQWLNTAEEEQQYTAGQSMPISNWALRQPLSQTITLDAPTGNVLVAAPDILRASIPINAVVRRVTSVPTQDMLISEDDLVYGDAVEISLARSDFPLEVGDSYTVVSQQTAITERALESAGIAYPPEITEQFLQLPDNVSAEVVQLAQDVAGGLGTPYAQAKAVENFLREYTYNDEIPAPAADQDPLEYFLFDIKEGYCDYYATSMTIMLRSLGLPTRTVSGYAEGTLDEDTGLYLITERDAHTWVEVYFPGYGWIEFEPTAGESELSRPRGEDPAAVAASTFADGQDPSDFEDPLLQDGFNPDFDNLPDEEFLDSGGGAALQSQNRWVWALVTGLALLGGLYLIWRSRLKGPTSFVPDMTPIIYDRVILWASRIGLDLKPSRTPYERATYLGAALPEGKPYIDEITDVYVRYQFGQTSSAEGVQFDGKTARMQNQLSGAWNQLRPILFKEWLRKIFHMQKSQRDPYRLVKK